VAMSRMLAVSIRKSGSSVSAKSSTRTGGLARAAIGIRPKRCVASHGITLRSSCRSDAVVVRWILATACSPVRRVAACTWAIEVS